MIFGSGPASLGAAAVLVLALTAGLSQAQNETTFVGLYGSGTTNPSKCIWDILSTISSGIRFPSRLTYRGVGSTIGQEEFINNFNVDESPVAFASGDIPILTSDYKKLKNKGIEVMHLPILLGAVSVFHTVPVAAPYQLNLTSCLLAKIYMGEIPRWSHPSIAKLNPNMQADMPIHVVVRDAGSSSTSSFTEYLHKSCSESFPESMVSDYPDGWPSKFSQCSGSAGVTACIFDTEGSIGYIDAGHGVDAGLDEIKLENTDGYYLSSGEAIANDGLSAAAKGQFPNNPLNDFGQVSLVDRPGKWTWPIVQASYLYVRRNITYVGSAAEQSLLVAFLDSFLNEDIVGVCASEYGFTLPSLATQAIVRSGIDVLKKGLPSDASPWTWETDATAFAGANPYTISTKARSIDAVQIEDLQTLVQKMQGTIDFLQTNVHELNTILERTGLVTGLVSDEVTESSADAGYTVTENFQKFTASQKINTKAALVLSSISFVLSMLILAMLLTKRGRKSQYDTQPALEQPQTVGA
ncbi:hypothetical protein MPSEU_001044200 [Mayamaea pseudoterrestris]|nr:hypothetical protein MPSEU_001044200 [Mayamaea pseudoterrestris]